MLYLLFGLLKLLLQFRQPGFELVDPGENAHPLVFQVSQLQATRAARAGRVLVLQGGRAEERDVHTFYYMPDTVAV